MKTAFVLAAILFSADLATAEGILELPGIEGIKIKSLTLSGASLADTVRLLTDTTGYNVVATEDVSGQRVSVSLREVTLKTALETICGLATIWYLDDPSSRVLRIMSIREAANPVPLPTVAFQGLISADGKPPVALLRIDSADAIVVRVGDIIPFGAKSGVATSGYQSMRILEISDKGVRVIYEPKNSSSKLDEFLKPREETIR